MTPRSLTGWGRTMPTVSTVETCRSVADVRSTLGAGGPRGAIARGLGRSYGDPAQNAGGTVLDLTGMDRVLDVDVAAATVTVEAGCSLDRLMRLLLPLGLWLPVVPGTRQVTVGGAIAADVHGKNHHRDGSFGRHVTELELVLPSGDVLTVRPDDADPRLFWATVGGMGLTGIVTQATIALHRAETSWFVVDTERTDDLRTLLASLAERDAAYPYSVAWFDAAARGSATGRSVITRGRAARREDLDAARSAGRLELAAPQLGRFPLVPPTSLVNPVTVRVFNELWFRKAPRHRVDELQDVTQFFHPLDVVADWNRVYGPRGFAQYQFVVPFGAESALRDMVTTLAASGHASFLNVLKRFGAADPAPLSFPTPGWTVAVDLPVRRGLQPLLDRLDGIVVDAGGRLYLAKDSRTSAATLSRMYPRLDEFRAVRDTVDPRRVLRSDLSRRLDL